MEFRGVPKSAGGRQTFMNRKPEAEGLEVIVVGSFNPAIFHPEWFSRHNLVGEEDAKQATINVVSGQVSEFKISGVKLLCVSDRLAMGIANMSLQPKVQDMLLQIFTLLPHTPIGACGINPWAHYQVHSVEYWHKIGHTLAPKELIWKDLVDKPGMQSLTIKAPREGEFPGELNLTVEPSLLFPPGIVAKSNYHFGLPVDSFTAGGTELLSRFLKEEWDAACRMARTVAEKIFEKITP
jgi:hypothetical protein